jgi:hypothetical protein
MAMKKTTSHSNPFSKIDSYETEENEKLQRIKESSNRKARQKPKHSDINFTHWWNDPSCRTMERATLEQDEAKAAAIYEGMRRRPEVQKAWLDGLSLFEDNGWQPFVGYVVSHLPLTWMELDSITKRGLVEEMLNPLFNPPRGYSTFPHDLPQRRTKENPTELRKLSEERWERATLHSFNVPEIDTQGPCDESARNALEFVRKLRRFVDAGFLIVGINQTSKQSSSYALKCLTKKLATSPPSFRKADLKGLQTIHLPEKISKADEERVQQKAKRGSFSEKDAQDLWDKYTEPTNELGSAWHKTSSVNVVPANKRKRKETLVAEKIFALFPILEQFVQLDTGRIKESDFVSRLRLS